MSLLNQYFSRRSDRESHELTVSPMESAAPVETREMSVQVMSVSQHDFSGADAQLISLMNSVKEQAVNLQCDHLKISADIDMRLDILANRMATLHPLLSKSVLLASEREHTISQMQEAESEMGRRITEHERELAHYKPLAIKLGQDLHATQALLAESQQQCAALEVDHRKANATINEYYQRVSNAEGLRQRAMEENAVFVQKINASDATIQALMRENATLRSEAINLASELERKEVQLVAATQKLSAATDETKRAKVALAARETETAQSVREAHFALREAEDHSRRSVETLNEREKQIYDLEVKLSAVQSKADYLHRTNERLRDEVRRHVNHIGNIEASNRQLLDTLSRTTAQLEQADASSQDHRHDGQQASNVLTLPRINEDRDAAVAK